MFTHNSESCCTLAGLKLLMLGQSDKAELCSLLEPDTESMQCRLCEDVHPIEAYDKGPCTFLAADLLTLHRLRLGLAPRSLVVPTKSPRLRFPALLQHDSGD